MIRRVSLVAAGLSALTLLSVGQDDYMKKAPNPGESRVRVNEMRDGKAQVLKGANETRNKADLMVMAKSLMYPVTDPVYYAPPEPNPKKPNELAPVNPEIRFDSKLEDLEKYVLKPTASTKYSFDQRDYIHEMGIAFNTVLKELYQPNLPPYVRLNTVRMLESVAKSGAPAHEEMITNLIADPNTPPEVLVYALKAAGNLLGAYDPGLAGGLTFGNHTLKDAELVKLIAAIEAVINRQTPYGKAAAKAAAPDPKNADGIVKDDPKKDTSKSTPPKAAPKGGKIESTVAMPFDDEQALMIRFIRRQAIRALSQVRVPVVTEAKSNVTVRPLFTLCRIAVNDGPFLPALGAEEYGDAVLGLANLHTIRGVDVDTVANCMAIGARNFANKKGSNVNIPWATYGYKLNNAFAELQKTIALNTTMSSATPKLSPVISLITTKIATPLEKSSKTNPGAIAVNEVVDWINNKGAMVLVPYTDLQPADKTKLTLKPVDPS